MSKIDEQRNHPVIAFLDTLIEGYTLYDVVDFLEANNAPELNKKKKAIYRSTIISICAAWESFLEALVKDGLKCIIANSTNSTQIPINIRLRISSRLKTNDERQIWKISDDGWKNELLVNFNDLKEKFNTPRPEKVDEFIFQTLGIKKISNSWKWKGQSASKSIQRLNEFMTLRGDITHRLTSSKNVYAHILIDYTNFLYRLSILTSNEIRKHIYGLVNVYPWKHDDPRQLLPRGI